MVFQDYALYPHMNVFNNLAFSLSLKNVPRNEMEARVAPVAEMLGLGDLLSRRPSELSGGQRQRVAVGRAIVRNPTVFLMDEPLSNLDAGLRVRTRTEIKKLQKELGITTVFVTHDQEEAMVLSDRVAVLKDGILQQYAEPEEAYGCPANLFVAGFIGSPAMNFIDGEMEIEKDKLTFRFLEHSLRLPTDILRSSTLGQGSGKRNAVLGIRPEHLTLGDSCSDTGIVGEVFLVEPAGSITYIDLKVRDILLKGTTDPDRKSPTGETVTMGFLPSKVHLFDPQTEERL
jgi:multiple sugar transport system ATP-binding protein